LQDSEQQQTGPDWLWYVGGEIKRLETLGQRLDESVVKAVYFWSLCLEIDDIPRPVVYITSRFYVRIVWRDARKTLALECRSGHFEIQATSRQYQIYGRFSDLRWIEPSRRAMRWMFPDDASGHPVGTMFKEIERS
jgi:hypothetical protein